MPAERAGYTVTMFLIDVAPTMGKLRQVEIPSTKPGESTIVEMTNLEWSLQFVMLKIQEMVRTAKCPLS
ncbi:uncharacterized protein C8Q71DRAFT_55143 [Rhodofomes roseus]|uniref:Uncharacterized protein n=1 Tax=Rhodofomes roseus TaxID=34475 RepID=A0ABQ8KHD2_9APHY|nr:uncharacterized protein C8Q71DRAFT_55143 [Rhodofomes roseus]KAH9836704.1 hypothetical protein C8Q71DRAFT_55143 [Rhodofomes roseus]